MAPRMRLRLPLDPQRESRVVELRQGLGLSGW